MEKLPRLKDRKILEKEITHEIREYLNVRHIFHWKQWQGLGSAHGVPDLIGIYRTRFLAIEVKTAKGILSEKQTEFLNRINHEAGIGFVARSVEDVISHLERVDQNINAMFGLEFRGY